MPQIGPPPPRTWYPWLLSWFSLQGFSLPSIVLVAFLLLRHLQSAICSRFAISNKFWRRALNYNYVCGRTGTGLCPEIFHYYSFFFVLYISFNLLKNTLNILLQHDSLSTFNGVLCSGLGKRKNFYFPLVRRVGQGQGQMHLFSLHIEMMIVVDINHQIQITIMKYAAKDAKSLPDRRR